VSRQKNEVRFGVVSKVTWLLSKVEVQQLGTYETPPIYILAISSVVDYLRFEPLTANTREYPKT